MYQIKAHGTKSIMNGYKVNRNGQTRDRTKFRKLLINQVKIPPLNIFTQMNQCLSWKFTSHWIAIISIKLYTCTKVNRLGNLNKSRGCSTEQIVEIFERYNPSNHEIPLTCHNSKQERM